MGSTAFVRHTRRTPAMASSMVTKQPSATFTGSGTTVMSRLQPVNCACPPPGVVSAKNSVQLPLAELLLNVPKVPAALKVPENSCPGVSAVV
jgi:hypothetical protein